MAEHKARQRKSPESRPETPRPQAPPGDVIFEALPRLRLVRRSLPTHVPRRSLGTRDYLSFAFLGVPRCSLCLCVESWSCLSSSRRWAISWYHTVTAGFLKLRSAPPRELQ